MSTMAGMKLLLFSRYELLIAFQQNLNQTLVYRKLWIGTQPMLFTLASRIASLEAADFCTGVGRYVRVLHLDDTLPLSDGGIDRLFSILLFTDRLEDVRFSNSTTAPALLVLARVSHCTVHSLSLPWKPTFWPYGACVPQLVNLTCLLIRQQADHRTVNWDTIPAWTLPNLRELRWLGGQPRASDFRDTRFLARCHFPTLRLLVADFLSLQEGRQQPLKDFLEHHPTIETLSLILHDWRAAAFMPHVRARHLIAIRTLPAVGVSLPTSVCTLSVKSSVHDGEVIFTYLAGLAASRVVPAEIHVGIIGCKCTSGPFLWTGGSRSPEHAMFLSHLLSSVPLLKARGARLLDEQEQAANVS
jgi:hypothetical protein